MMEKIHARFLAFLKQLFQSFEYSTEITHGVGDEGIDLIVTQGEKKIFAEVKVNRTKHVPPLINGLLQLRFAIEQKGAQRGIVIITSIISPSIAEELTKKYGILIWDRSVLFELTEKNYDLRKELEDILSELKQSGEEDVFEGVVKLNNFKIASIWHSSLYDFAVAKPVTIGQNLCKELKAIPPGKPTSTLFEKKCEDILKYIFDVDLSNWTPQNSTDDTLHRFDAIARIISPNDFWKFIARDFKTRFVIFECKNYTDPITQSEVYTTEKYLYTTALRTFAIIISPNGADKNAATAMKGSLREHGKLIICLTTDEICKMLHMKDRGDDPNNLLSEKIDKLLMQLSR